MKNQDQNTPLHIIMIDNYDSFTYNLVDQFRRLGAEVVVFRNDTPLEQIFTEQRLQQPNTLVVISPGPGNPDNAGHCLSLLQTYSGRLPILGICLGHQAIVQACGGRVGGAKQIVHGKADNIHVLDSEAQSIFDGLPNPFRAARYHSLVATQVPQQLEVIATCDDEVMAVRHRTAPLLGLQFHPESILTTHGKRLLENALQWLLDTATSSDSIQIQRL